MYQKKNVTHKLTGDGCKKKRMGDYDGAGGALLGGAHGAA
jgi:hypothetical protein